MKVLILSCNTGEGHNSAARAIYQHITSSGNSCVIQDTLSFISIKASKFISDIYIYSTKTDTFKYIYNMGMDISLALDKTKSPVYLLSRLYAKKLRLYIEKEGFDAVICTHLFPAEAMTAIRRNGHTDIPAIFIMTDYTCIPFLNETELDSYVIPHEHLIEEFTIRGIQRSRLYPLGIPVDKSFYVSSPKMQTRQTLSESYEWNISPQNNWFLIMTGSMGYGSTQEIIDETIRQSPDGTEIIAVCGRNDELHQKIRNDNRHISTVHTLGYSDRIPLLMDACDVLFTKPGGISSTEAMAKAIPIIHTKPIPGLEARNAEFFHYHGMSYSSTDVKQQVQTAIRLCKDTEFRKKMTGAQKANAKPDTCHNIMSLLTDRAS